MAFGLGNGVRWVDGRRDAANRSNRVEGRGIFQRVGREDAENVPLAETEFRQTRRHAPYVLGKLAEGQRPAAQSVDQGGFVGQSRGMAEDEGGQRRLRDRDRGIRAAEDHRRSSFLWGRMERTRAE